MYDTSNQMNSDELIQLKTDIQELKKSISIFELLLFGILLIIIGGIGIILLSKKKEKIKNEINKVYNDYKTPISN